jgi:hypothetical protein
MVSFFIEAVLLSKLLSGIKENSHRAGIAEADFHHGLKLAAGRADAITCNRLNEIKIELLGQLWRRSL